MNKTDKIMLIVLGMFMSGCFAMLIWGPYEPPKWEITFSSDTFVEMIEYDKDEWLKEDIIIEDSRCWTHWITDEEGNLIVRDGVYCVPN